MTAEDILRARDAVDRMTNTVQITRDAFTRASNNLVTWQANIVSLRGMWLRRLPYSAFRLRRHVRDILRAFNLGTDD